MRLRDIVPPADVLKLAQGVEATLVRRKRAGSVAAVAALAWAIVQVLLAAQTPYLDNVGSFVGNLLSGEWRALFGEKGIKASELIGMAVLGAGFGTYFLLNWTSFLLKETEEPFRYTFWIEPFAAAGAPESGVAQARAGQMPLLHRDLIEKLNQRIQRLSLLDNAPSGPAGAEALASHIHISGNYAIREEKPGQWIIHIMARIRVGAGGKPETLAYPVKYPLKLVARKKAEAGKPGAAAAAPEHSLDVESYKRIVERVYSRVATEIYRQIEVDVKGKIDLFPTSYLRAVALFREAQDLAKSNTIDAYDHAIALYRQALRYFNVANVKPLTRLLLWAPIAWRCQVRFIHTQAMVQVGYAQSLIYRRRISEYSGRHRNTLFEISEQLAEVIGSLTLLHNKMNRRWRLVAPEARQASRRNRLNTLMAMFTYPRDSWTTLFSPRPSQALFQRQSQILFDCYVVAALTHYNLGSIQAANRYLRDAKAAGPGLTETNPLYLLAAGEIESDREKAVLLLRQATELGTSFEIAQYSLATSMEALFRKKDELLEERSRIVMKEYDEVLAINPGNIAALASQGYLLWLLEDFEGAKRKFDDGRENKAISRQTFVGELNYGLARIAAEEGRFGLSYDLYTQTLAAEPGVGAYSLNAGRLPTTRYYEDISLAMLARYARFKKKVETNMAAHRAGSGRRKIRDADKEEVSERMLNVVHSCVLNDYGNACFTYFQGVGDPAKLDEAIRAFELARKYDPESKIVPYNLHMAYLWRNREEDKVPAQDCLEKAQRLGPTWPLSVFALAQARLRQVQESMMKTMDEAEKQAIVELRERQRLAASAARGQRSGVSRSPSLSPSADAGAGGVQPESLAGEQPGVLGSEQPVQDRSESAQSLYDKAMTRLGELEQKVLPKALEIMGATKLASIVQGFDFDIQGNGVDRLLSADIGRDRLDENDVRALRLWAEVLSNNLRSEQALRTAEKICSYILESYYPESFEVISIVRYMYLNKKRELVVRSSLQTESARKARHDYAIEESDRKLQKYTDLLKPIIRDWTERNPAGYAELTWAREVFVGEQQVLVEILERTVKLAPDNAVFWNFLGITYEAIEDGRSVGCYRKAIELDPRTVVYHQNLGAAFGRRSLWKEAQAAYRDAIALEPRTAAYWSSLGNTYFWAGAYDEARDAYGKAIELDSKTVVYQTNLGSALEKLGRWADARSAYLAAIALDPENAAHWNSLGNGYYWDEAYDRAIEHYRKASELDPDVAVYHQNMGASFEKLERWAEAQIAYRDALALDQTNAGYWNSLGNAYYSGAAYARSEDSYRKAIELDPQTAVYRQNLGGALAMLGRWKEAQTAIRAALDLTPESASAWNALGNAYYWNEEYADAIGSYQEAIRLNAGSAVYYVNLGSARAKLGRWTDAQAAFRTAVDLDPNSANTWNLLGNAYFSGGARDRAAESYRKAVELDSAQAVYRENLERAIDQAAATHAA
jgi:tetratricopeptide (TPR) repeat protein